MSETASRDKPAFTLRLRAQLTLPRTQALLGILAACLSIGGSIYGYLRYMHPSDRGEVVTIVRDQAGKAIPGAMVEVLTLKDALVTTITAGETPSRSTLKEGTYRFRVSHPKYVPEVRTVQVIAGQTSEFPFRLSLRPAPPPKEPPKGGVMEDFKKIFR